MLTQDCRTKVSLRIQAPVPFLAPDTLKPTNHVQKGLLDAQEASTAKRDGHTARTDPTHDSSMGRLEHRLEASTQQSSEEHEQPHTSDYGAWVHNGTNGSHAHHAAPAPAVQKRMSVSGSRQPQT